ncbi:MAG: hypothetical protein M3237_20270, partial [Actinomycetota bacterium]|nr:hypothetical protein [Actinomycetota bacterium]
MSSDDEDDSTPDGGRRSEPPHAEGRRARWRRRREGEDLGELDASAAQDFIRRSARLDRPAVSFDDLDAAPEPLDVRAAEPADAVEPEGPEGPVVEDPFALVETPEARAARLRLENDAARKVIADALQVGMADPEPPPAARRGARTKMPTGPLPAERSQSQQAIDRPHLP